jgi:NAD(P)-dependent dehydrogenase (short-subunit alcohol dehydrogenase family)
MTQRLTGKKALVTGAGGALGRAAALGLAAQGAQVAVCDLNAATARETTRMISDSGGRAVTAIGDVSDDADCERMFREAEAALGGLNVLFNNAGVLLPDDAGPVDTPVATWTRTLAINLSGVFLCCRHGIPALERAGGGSVINTASIVALAGSVFPQIAYTAAKGGVLSMTRELAVLYAVGNIRFNALCPGPVNTELTAAFFDSDSKWHSRQAFIPAGRLGTPEEIANMVVFLASDESSYVTGAVLPVDGGITAAYVASNLEGRL